MSKSDYPSHDGKFLGTKYHCAICGQTYRRYEMLRQRGKLVCRETCWDKPQEQWVGTEKTRR